MTTGSLGLRSSGSYGSLQQFQNISVAIQTTPPIPPRKPPKMFKEKEGLFVWICKVAPRKKVGMLLLCAVSAAVFVWVLYVGKGEDSQGPGIPNININNTIRNREFLKEPEQKNNLSPKRNSIGGIAASGQPPLPPVYFTGYTLPPGNPCEGFTLPPPPADKKRTGPRPCPVCYLPVEEAIALMPNAPSFSPIVKDLTYIHEENLVKRAFDLVRQPMNISEYAKKNVCFYMFVDNETEEFLRNSSDLDSSMRLGLWRIVVVHKLPYSDARRNGKIPKLLLHRLFPNARYSLWIDGKLELVVDPYQLLERFLWRKNASFAISRHYRRFDVFVEAEANKAAGKFDNASIDFQIEFYKKEGLTPFSAAKFPITSDVPEGCVILREHIPISNLFTCLWFNEVDRFTPRDQISFCTVRDRIRSRTNWTVEMFLDCERRNFVVQGYHRDILEQGVHPPPLGNSAVIHPHP
nr:uncharacterized protein LOC109158820 [Ipomoea batatas]